jgi:hypothetical protein
MSAPYRQAIEEAQNSRAEDASNPSQRDTHWTIDEVGLLSTCQSGSPDSIGDHFAHEPLQLNAASIRLVEVLPILNIPKSTTHFSPRSTLGSLTHGDLRMSHVTF